MNTELFEMVNRNHRAVVNQNKRVKTKIKDTIIVIAFACYIGAMIGFGIYLIYLANTTW